MKMHLNLIAAMVLAGFTMFSAAAQTRVNAEGRIRMARETNPVATPGGLLLDAGGTRRVVVRMEMEGTHALRVQLANLQEYQTSVSLLEPDGTIRWEQEVANKQAFAKMFDLKTLSIDPGAYTLRVQTGAATLNQELVVTIRSVILGATRHSTAVPGTPAMAGK
ncbi:MAG: hypothetical protein JNJ90_12190 [Saprospiraceae bacterium]|jgi:hypothetical protein|nr:hypothetical protein [Saprospiraceae bacterium]